MLPLGNKTGHLPLRYYKAHLKNCTYGSYQAHHTIQIIHSRRFQDQGKTVIKTLEIHSPTPGQEDPRQDPPTQYTCPADYSSHTWSPASVCCQILPHTVPHCVTGPGTPKRGKNLKVERVSSSQGGFMERKREAESVAGLWTWAMPLRKPSPGLHVACTLRVGHFLSTSDTQDIHQCQIHRTYTTNAAQM